MAAAIVATPSQAMPAFARQTGKACTTCHFQHYPILNEYGQEFKASGYTDMGKQGEVKGKELSIPGIFNASLYTKVRYQKSNGTDGRDAAGNSAKTTHSGELQFPDEFALLIGGRVAENIGFMIENQFAGGGKGFLAGFKLPMVYKVGKGMKAGVTPFLTDGLGASYGFEQMSTGAVRNIRSNEHRNETSALQYVFFGGSGPRSLDAANQDPYAAAGTNTRIAAGAASGVAFSLWDPAFNVAYTFWTPHHLAEAGSNAGGLSSGLLRAVWTPTFGDWSMGIGVQAYSGSNVRLNNAGTIQFVDTKGTGFDVQAHGAVANMPLGLYFTYATTPGSKAGCNNTTGLACNLFNENPNTKRATAILAELGVLPSKATLSLGYRSANSGAAAGADGGSDNSWTLGGTYQITQNVQLQVDHSTRSKRADGVGRYGVTNCTVACATPTTRGTSMTTFMLSAGF
ncbi:MAG: hypothetical protein HZC24_12625 [Rhodocyclales bacterium]|nr:hypothetical protein [Rhodocyclales bacterium]